MIDRRIRPDESLHARSRGVANTLLVALLLSLATTADAQAQKPRTAARPADASPTGVSINRVALGPQTVRSLEAVLGGPVAPADYWYDPFSGLYGHMGGPGLGFTVPGLEVGGPLPADASGGGTHVFVNGRELHPMDVAALMAVVGPVLPGRYWLRYDGSYGVEGGPPMGNLAMLAQQQAGGAGYNRTSIGGHLGSDGQTSYYFDPGTGCSVIPGGGVSC